MDMQRVPAREGNYNLKNYDELRSTFKWEDVHKRFSWNETGKVNIAYEELIAMRKTQRKR